MPGYMAKELHNLQHNLTSNIQHQLHPHVPQNYEAKTQYTTPLDDSKTLNNEGNKFTIQVTGTF